jgi:hypothetical protein
LSVSARASRPDETATPTVKAATCSTFMINLPRYVQRDIA